MRWIFGFLLFAVSSLFSEIGFVEPWGKDSDLIPNNSKIPPLPQHSGLMTKLAEYTILFHQNIISPVDGPRSHFRPTSSRYMLLAMKRHGFIKGYLMGCDRLLRENKEKWVYRTRTIDGEVYKWDPTFSSYTRKQHSASVETSHSLPFSDIAQLNSP